MHSQPAIYNFPDIISRFALNDASLPVVPFGSGHINDTFLVHPNAGGHQAYLLQKINHYVFKDVIGLMGNMVKILTHLKQKVALEGGDPEKQVLTLVPAKDGGFFYRDQDDNYWRMTWYLANTNCYDVVSTAKQARQGGVAFGRFQRLLADLDPSLIVDTIPDFLNIKKRLNDFDTAIASNLAGRADSVSGEIGFLKSRAAVMNDLLNMGLSGIIPLRITHNDTKFNNILLDSNNNIQCVIDLDTVMPGYAAYDFGDAIRSIINTAPEDEKDIKKIALNMPLFIEFTKGYLGETQGFLTEAELTSLVKGVLLMPYMQAVRFLTDHLNGDIYYKIQFAGHNLQRTRAQLQLYKLLEMRQKELQDIIRTQYELTGTEGLSVPSANE